MKTATVTLQNYLINNNKYEYCDLVTITPVVGAAIYLTNADLDLTVSSITYSHNTFGFKRSSTKIHIGLQVDEMDFSMFDFGSNTVAGVSIYEACANGYFDNAHIKVQRLFKYPDQNADYLVWLFEGNVANANPMRHNISFKVKSELEKLNLPVPRNLYQPTCVNTLYDTNCAVVKATYTKTGTVSSVASKSVFSGTLSTTPTSGLYDLGYVTFTSGANNGLSRSIKTQTGTTTATMTLYYPLPYTIANADTFSITQGCDKTYDGGCTKFANTAAFRGFDFIPRNEDAQ